MNRHFLSLCLLTVLPALLTACAAPAPPAPDLQAGAAASGPERVTVNVMALKGPTAMGMVQMMDLSDRGETDLDLRFTLTAAVDEVTAALVKETADIAAVPANLAAVLYAHTQGAVQVLAVNTLGVLYIVERGGEIGSAEDLRGRRLYASGKGSTPEYALRWILSQNGLDPDRDLQIEWMSQHDACLSALLSQGEGAAALLPQPFVAAALDKDAHLRVALDLTQEWDRIQAGSPQPSALIGGVAVARRAFVEAHPEAVSAFLDAYQTSVDFVNTQVEAAADLVGAYGIVPAETARAAIPGCSIVLIRGQEMQKKLAGYFSVLLAQEPKSVGGALPADDFYCIP